MEKIIYVLWRDAGESADDFGRRLRENLAPKLQHLGARSLKLNVADSAVAAGAGLKQTHADPPVECVLQLWVDSAIAQLRRPFDEAVAAAAPLHASYLVTESQPLINRKHPPAPGQRSEGFAQMALFRKPAAMDYREWLATWHDSHTQIAIDTQSNFEYIQNVVIRRLSATGPDYDAIVEEGFPIAALNDPQMFFDAQGDEAKFRKNLDQMMWSVGRFIDMARIDVCPTSQYPMF